jgi:hypothetical protein
MSLRTLEERLSEAVAHFWKTRGSQLADVGGNDKAAYAGTRGAVVGGGHLDGFAKLIREILVEGGLPQAHIYPNDKRAILPGFFRPNKAWDLIVVGDHKLIACAEFKSQVGSFGNNFNNRVEEALGNATDIHTAFREGAFKPSPAPWLGYLMILEDCPKSNTPVRNDEPHFPVLKEFHSTSYAGRYELFCTKLVRERLYNSACLLKSSKSEGLKGKYHEASAEVGFTAWTSSLIGHISGIARMKGKK